MLTGNLLRVRYSKSRVVPNYIDASDGAWLAVAEGLLQLFRSNAGRTRGELDEQIRDLVGNDPSQFIHQGLAKLLEDRCEFEVATDHAPDQLRETVFLIAAERRRHGSALPPLFEVERGEPDRIAALPSPPFPTRERGPGGLGSDRAAVLAEAAQRLNRAPAAVEQALFADLRSEQRLVSFKDISSRRLLERYNVALAQAVLLRSTKVEVIVRNEAPARYRQLFRLTKFHRLVCEVRSAGTGVYSLTLDGPLSLFSATQKYGLQLALFLPALLLCKDFGLKADLLWGPQRKPRTFTLTPAEGLVSHLTDPGTYVPPELRMFAELFRKKVADWDIHEEADVHPLGDGFWVPDFRLVHRATGRAVLLEVLGFWRRSSVECHLERLRQHVREPFLLAVSDQLRVDDADLAGLPAAVHRFRQMPQPDAIARLAEELVSSQSPT